MDWSQIKNLTIDENILDQLSKQKRNHCSINDSGRIAEGVIDILFGS